MALMFTTGTNLPGVGPLARGLHLNNFLYSPRPSPPIPPLPAHSLASRLPLTAGPAQVLADESHNPEPPPPSGALGPQRGGPARAESRNSQGTGDILFTINQWPG